MSTVRLDILAWLLVPLAVTLVAVVWVRWRARPKGPADAHEGVADMRRFQQAMAKPLPRSHQDVPDRRSAVDGSDQGAA